jgi:hypothetical protein
MDIEFANQILDDYLPADKTADDKRMDAWEVLLPALIAGGVGAGGGGLVGYNYFADDDKDSLVADRRKRRNAVIGALLGSSLLSGVVGAGRMLPYMSGSAVKPDLSKILGHAAAAGAVGGGIGVGSAAILGDDPVLALENPELAKKKRRDNMRYGGLLGAGAGAMLASGANIFDQGVSNLFLPQNKQP